MTKEEWKEVEEQLKFLYSLVKLKCDNYEIILKLIRISPYKNVIQAYINGVFKGEWLMKDCEERRRFCRPINKSLLSAKQKQGLKRLSKRSQKQMGIDIDKKYTYYSSYWLSFKALKSHLIKNNSSIELVASNTEVKS